VPGQAEPVGEVHDDVEVLPRLARQAQRLAPHLHLAVGVGGGAVLLRPGRGRQHDIGQRRRLRQEQVLHDKVVEPGEGGAGMRQVGVRHRGVLAHHVHAGDLAALHRAHDLDHGQAGPRVERRAPQRLQPRRASSGLPVGW
jgi:hypothetical protein